MHQHRPQHPLQIPAKAAIRQVDALPSAAIAEQGPRARLADLEPEDLAQQADDPEESSATCAAAACADPPRPQQSEK